MKAIVINESTYAIMLDGINLAYQQRKMTPYWSPVSVKIKSGVNKGMIAVPLGDNELSHPMIMASEYNHDAPKTIELRDLPDFKLMMQALGDPAIVEIEDDQLDFPPAFDLNLLKISPQAPVVLEG